MKAVRIEAEDDPAVELRGGQTLSQPRSRPVGALRCLVCLEGGRSSYCSAQWSRILVMSSGGAVQIGAVAALFQSSDSSEFLSMNLSL
jgi:hypothetical protein